MKINSCTLNNIGISVVVTIILLIATELIFSFSSIGELPDSVDYKYIKHGLYNPFLIFGPNINITRPQLYADDIYFNSQGFRLNHDLPLNKNSSIYRVFALGGSTTENMPNEHNVHYPHEAELFLSKDMDIEIINVGMSGYSTAQNLVRFQYDLLQFNPDAITVMNNINDLIVNLFPVDYRFNYANVYLTDRFATEYSYKEVLRKCKTCVFLNQALLNIKLNVLGDEVKTSRGTVRSTMIYTDKLIELKYEEAFRNNLIAIASIGKAHNITVVFMSQPALLTDEYLTLMFGAKTYNNKILYPHHIEFTRIFERYNEVIKEVAIDQNVYFIDMYNLMPKNETYFHDAFHYTEEGVMVFSSIYAQELKSIIKEVK